MKSLRERLAQFDRPATPRAERVDAGDPLATLVEMGARWVGSAPTGYLRLDEDLAPRPRPERSRTDEACRRLCDVEPTGEGWVVLDTETTGLESGTGTFVFLVGLVHWTPDACRRVQLFLPEPAGEAALLHAAVEECADADLIISYNGRSFDLPRLRTRLRLHRREADVFDRPHLDLVHPARRLLREWADGLRQADLERQLLGTHRDDDLPGAFAPEVYRTLLADHRDGGLRGVVDHNARDVDRLTDLANWFVELVTAPTDGTYPRPVRRATARLLAHRDRWDAAEALLRGLIDEDGADLAARRILAHGLRRAGRFEEAAVQWKTIARAAPLDVQAHVEWAKLCEHRLRDLEAAQRAADGALRAATDLRVLDPGAPSMHAELVHRLRRIQRRRTGASIDATRR